MSPRPWHALVATLLFLGFGPSVWAAEPPPSAAAPSAPAPAAAPGKPAAGTPAPAETPGSGTSQEAAPAQPAEAAAPAETTSKDNALEYYFEGQSLYQKELYLQAINSFKRSYELYPANQTLYAIAKSYEKLGMGAECVGAYERYLDVYRKDKKKDPPDLLDIKNAITKCKLGQKLELIVKSEPSGAQVYLNSKDKLLGQTPYKTRLDPGSYTLILEYPNYETLTKTIQLRAGEPQSFLFKLARPTHSGTILLAANIARATIYVDGQNVGRTPYQEALVVSAGRHQVTVDKEDYAPYTTTVDVADGHHVRIRAELWLRDAPSTWKSPVGWTSLVLGTLVVGGGVAASLHADTLYRGTPDFETFQQLQFIGYGAGGALAGLGLALLIWEAADTHAIKDGDAVEQAYVPSVRPFVAVDEGGGVGGLQVGF